MKRPASRKRPKARLRTVRVPEAVEPTFLRAQGQVERYFKARRQDPRLGTISISGERYILLRAASMSVEFVDLVTSLCGRRWGRGRMPILARLSRRWVQAFTSTMWCIPSRKPLRTTRRLANFLMAPC